MRMMIGRMSVVLGVSPEIHSCCTVASFFVWPHYRFVQEYRDHSVELDDLSLPARSNFDVCLVAGSDYCHPGP